MPRAFKTAIEPEVIEQLQVWAVELADEAEQIDWREAEDDETIVEDNETIVEDNETIVSV